MQPPDVAQPAPPNDARQALTSAAQGLGFALSEPQTDALLRFLALLQRWNTTYNLTAIRDPAQMLTQHLADCLAVVGPLRRHCAETGAHQILDVGSGGGLPGVVLAVLNPDLSVTCVDTVGKKTAFVRQVAVELGLKNLSAEHARVEKLSHRKFDIITSRAFASLADFVRWTGPSLAPGGVWLAMKGKVPVDEMAALPSSLNVFHVEQLRVPNLPAERCLVWIRPTG